MVINKNIFDKINSLQHPILIGVSGFGGSGKTTFANQLGNKLNAPVISIDSFNKGITEYSNWELMDFNRLEEEVLIPFTSGKTPISYTHYDGGKERTSKEIMVTPQGILIVEGVGLIRPDLMKYFSYTIWIDCPIDEATRRGKKRDREVWNNPKDEQWEGIWKKNDVEYYQNFEPQTKVDLVINNSLTEK